MSTWIDKHGDVWTLGDDGLLHTPETAPMKFSFVEKKWGPLRPVDDPMTRPQPTASTDVEALVEIVNDATVTHPMWIDANGEPLDYLPEREAQISDFVHGLAAELAAYVQAARDEERARVLGEVQRVFDMQCPPMASENYMPGAWAAHSWWNTVLGSTLRRLREARGGAR